MLVQCFLANPVMLGKLFWNNSRICFWPDKNKSPVKPPLKHPIAEKGLECPMVLNDGTRRLFLTVFGQLLYSSFHVSDETKWKGRFLACQRRLPLLFFAVLAATLSLSSSFSALNFLNFPLLLKMSFKVD